VLSSLPRGLGQQARYHVVHGDLGALDHLDLRRLDRRCDSNICQQARTLHMGRLGAVAGALRRRGGVGIDLIFLHESGLLWCQFHGEK